MVKADKLAQRVNATPDTEDPDLPFSGQAAANLPAMTLDFRSNGQLITTTKMGKIDSQKAGHWRLIKFEPPSTMTVECHIDEQSEQSRKLEVELIDDQTIRMTPPNMTGQRMKLNFKKQ